MTALRLPKIQVTHIEPTTPSPNIKKSSGYIQSLINQQMSRTELYFRPCVLKPIANEDEALDLFYSINSHFKLGAFELGAVNLPSLKIVIFQTPTNLTFFLDYSDCTQPILRAAQSSDISMRLFHFDPNTGYTGDPNTGYHDLPNPETIRNIVVELNKFFIIWQNNGKKGDVISEGQANFYLVDLKALREKAKLMRIDRQNPASPFYEGRDFPKDLAIEIALMDRGSVPLDLARKEVTAIIYSPNIPTLEPTPAKPAAVEPTPPEPEPRADNEDFLAEFHQKHRQQFEWDKRQYYGLLGWMRKTEISEDWTLSQLVAHGLKRENRTQQVMLAMGWLHKNAQGVVAINETVIQYDSTTGAYHFNPDYRPIAQFGIEP